MDDGGRVGLDADAVIVGAGPAGCAVALGLVARGHHVVVVDRAAFPREKICGEGLMPHGVRELERLGLLQAAEATGARRFTGIAYHAGGAEAVGRFPDGAHGLGLRRVRLDAALVAEARARDVPVRLELPVRGVEVGETGVRVETDAGPIRARVLVGADGMQSLVRRKLGLDVRPRGRLRWGGRAHYRLAEGRPDPDVVGVHAAEGGEFYLTPVGPSELNVAVLLEREAVRDFKGDADAAFWRLVEGYRPVREILDGATCVEPVGLCGPLRQQARDVVAERAVLVGDAAGFIDGITGEGMSLTLLSARLAVDTLDDALHADRLGAEDLRPYARERARAVRDLTRLTEIVLWGIRRRRLAAWVVRNLGRFPETFGRLLAVNAGQPLGTLTLRDGVRMLGGF